MGIRGFDSFIRPRVAGVEVVFAPSARTPRTLIVDGNGFAHWLHVERDIDTFFGCDGGAIDEGVAWFVSAFRAAGVSLVFVFDGAREQHKARTQHDRRAEKLGTMQRVMHQLQSDSPDGVECCPASVELVASARSQLVPPLAVRCIIDSLRARRVAIVCALEEADAAMAHVCASLRCDGILALDSDFFFHAHQAAYIPFNTLRFRESNRGGDASVEITASSFTRERVAVSLGLTCEVHLPRTNAVAHADADAVLQNLILGGGASEMALLACLVGNDATSLAPWLPMFHDRLAALPIAKGVLKRREAHHPHNLIRALVAWLVAMRVHKNSRKPLTPSLALLLFGARGTAEEKLDLALELAAASAVYDFGSCSLAFLARVHRIVHECGIVCAHEADHGASSALVDVFNMTAHDGHRVHERLIELHVCGEFCHEWFTLIRFGELWLPLHAAASSPEQPTRALDAAFSVFRARAIALLLSNLRAADAAAILINEQLSALSLQDNTHDCSSVASVASTASDIAVALSSAATASPGHGSSCKARKRRATKAASAAIAASSVPVGASRFQLLAVADSSAESAEDATVDSDSTVFVSEHGLFENQSGKLRLRTQYVPVLSCTELLGRMPSTSLPLYHAALDAELSLAHRRRVLLRVIGLDTADDAVAADACFDRSDALWLIAVAACCVRARRVERCRVGSNVLVEVESSASCSAIDGAEAALGDEWASFRAPCAFALSHAILQRYALCDVKTLSAHVAFSLPAMHALHAVEAVLELLQPVNVALGFPYARISLGACMNGRLVHRCFAAIECVHGGAHSSVHAIVDAALASLGCAVDVAIEEAENACSLWSRVQMADNIAK